MCRTGVFADARLRDVERERLDAPRRPPVFRDVPVFEARDDRREGEVFVATTLRYTSMITGRITGLRCVTS
jgi:hypothetical protein